ncbi:hypothetical protein NC651_006199 [Populus alba x Populus x berolinensis]|nr:hypothetical protein NC651_006199 [Populus alba x Populus x berolinensis]
MEYLLRFRIFLGSSCSTSLLKLLKIDSVGLQSRETSDQAALVMESPPEKEAITVGWRDAINKVIPAVVVLHVGPSTSNFLIGTATGFVVHKNSGIILTSRHVVKGKRQVLIKKIYIYNFYMNF